MSDNFASYSLAGTKLYILSSISLLLRWAVPVFFMISGAVLIRDDRNTTYSEVYKYCRRILLALLFFGTMFSMIEIFMDEKTLSFQMFSEAFFNVLIGKSWAHLWYLYSIIGIYLILPLINTFVSRAETKTVVIFMILLVVFLFIFPVINNIFDITIFFSIPIGSYTVLYFVTGKLLYQVSFNNKYKKFFSSLVLIVLSLLVVLINANGDNRYLGYDSPIVGGMAVCIFIIIKGIDIKNSGLLWKFDRLCFGVYLIHPVFINMFYKFFKITPLCFGEEYLVGVFFFWLGFIAVSYLTSYFMSKVKILSSIVS